MTTITREQLRERAREKVKSLEFAVTQTAFSENRAELEEELELARIALASLEAEPVGTFRKGPCGYSPSFHEDAMPLYAAPPAPVSVPDLKPVGFLFVSDDGSVAYSPAGWPMKGFNLIGPIYGDVNACRAAMLQGAEPASNRDELPLDYLQGHKDGLEWAAQLAEANHPQTGDWLYDDPIDLARAIRKGPDMPTVQGGSSPVTPDGWISCSERMPNDAQWCVVNTEYGYYVQCWSEGQGWLGDDISIPECDVINWMPLPEPPQEVK
ncbi:DUF551 domain-containing protein [Escherichia coli]|nr:DUF551 domain-containing protein [Escherichia coli]EFJ7593039.1 DUF551 domain-containing protein [Escherichia coli]